MRALVFTAPSTVEMQDVPIPVAGPGEVVLDVGAVAICGSELHGVRTPGFRTPPLVMGHELAGMTPDGRRVVVNPIVTCGRCDMCSRGRTQVCRERAIVGIHRPGGFAESVAVPEIQLHDIPEALSWDQAAMVEPLANAVHAVGLAGDVSGARVGVIGSGTIGLMSLLVARARGAGEVIVADIADSRLGLARRLGADATADALDGECDVVIDAVGAPATHAASVVHLAPGGTAVWIGLLSGEAGFDALELIRQEKRVLGSFAYSDAEFADAIEFAAVCPLDWIESAALDDGARIFTELMNGRTDIVKAVLRP